VLTLWIEVCSGQACFAQPLIVDMNGELRLESEELQAFTENAARPPEGWGPSKRAASISERTDHGSL